MIDYAAAQTLFRKHKGALTRAQKKGPGAVMRACDRFFADFENAGYPLPDDWHRWERARQDAEMEMRRNGSL